jgi:hypothetical protein
LAAVFPRLAGALLLNLTFDSLTFGLGLVLRATAFFVLGLAFLAADFLGAAAFLVPAAAFLRLGETAVAGRDAPRLGEELVLVRDERAAVLAALGRVRFESDSLIQSPLQRSLPAKRLTYSSG